LYGDRNFLGAGSPQTDGNFNHRDEPAHPVTTIIKLNFFIS